MLRNIARLGLSLLVFGGAISCAEEEKKEPNYLTDEIGVIKAQFAPDKRVALFDINAHKNGNTYILRGESNLAEAITALKNNLEAAQVAYIDSIQLLPSASLEQKTRALVTISVANLRSQPKHSAELATQATLGTPVKILKKNGGWVLIQTPDQYLSWVDSDGIHAMTEAEIELWKEAPKMIYTNINGNSYSEPDTKSQVVSDIVAGGILEIVGEENEFYKVVYPDQRIAFINKGEVAIYESWIAQADPSQENLVATSKKLIGLPYLWGGTSPKGVDCSGFTKTIYFLNGIVLPRDASQQIHTGEVVDDTKNFGNLLPGDLLFFGVPATETTPERVVHVGMWIGNNEFIHSAGRVKINSVDKDAPNYDAYNVNRYLRTKRPLNSDKGGLINLKQTPFL